MLSSAEAVISFSPRAVVMQTLHARNVHLGNLCTNFWHIVIILPVTRTDVSLHG